MKIIKKGRVYREECPNCGCVFEYTERDIDEYATVMCPECGEIINHTRESEWKG